MVIKTYQMIFFYIVLPVLGIGLIAFAVLCRERLSRRPVEIAVHKLGLSLKSDTLTLLILIGVILACVGVFFWYRGYETQLAGLKSELEHVETEKTTLNEVLERFNDYAMRFHLAFPREDIINAQEIKTQVYIAKHGQVSPKLYEAETSIGFSNDIWVKIDNLNPGDKLCIVAYEGKEKSWQSTDIEIPKAKVQMKRVQ